ncbi:unnamed protein product [Aspergillus oryzae var. brunneus]|uniref:Unnamed protein product n=1 Tax=Aspergillus oryzae var. brunneus TaxID=332754 RepID=A0ABQ6L340_ASPOZ|nr:unnamed protein product [Aspergillus oryzae var. brunneus]
MGRPSPQLDNSEYAVGWIAALPHERAAAKAMLDIVHAPPRHKHAKDHNSYTLGSINGPNGEHNVVIASLPSGRYGTVTAATAAKQMLSSFPSIKFGLMVGIGGGIPSDDHDIRLGDVVVSQPTGAFGGVRQYDCGKVTARGFEECGALNCPPEALLNAMGELQSNHEMMGGTSIPAILESMYAAYPAMADSRRGPAYIYQGADHDRLFCSDCIHEKGAKDCGGCNPEKEIKRPERLDQDPYIHYGTIASGNKVIKDAKMRDSLAKNCLCFEMEAAGLMNQFPCLVIRGICDYCDTHKNDRWQKYAAATAAAYAKELLQVTDALDIQNTPEARSIVMDNRKLDLVPLLPLRELIPLGSIGLAYLYGDYRDQRAQTTVNILGVIVKQLLAHLSEIPLGILEIYEARVKQENALSLPDAEKFLDITCEQFSRVYICLDALDELQDQRSLLMTLQARSSSIQLYITGRPHVRVTVEMHIKEKREIPIVAHDHDIRQFIDYEIGGPNDIEPDAMDEKLRVDIQDKIIESAKGVLVCEVHAILQSTTIRRREQALKTLPSDLGDAFAGTMARIEQQPHAQSEQAKKIIAWVYLAERPVSVDELLCSLAIEDDDKAFNPRGMPIRSTLINCCHGLVVIDQETTTVRLVHYSFQEYLCRQNQLFGVSKVQWHNQIARTCLTLLSFPAMGDEHSRINLMLTPYAVTKWGHHLRRSEHLPDAPLRLAQNYLHTVSTGYSESLRLLYKDMYGSFFKEPSPCSTAHIVAVFGLHRVMLWSSSEAFFLDTKDIEGKTPLSWAAMLGHAAVVELLVEQGALIDSEDSYNRTPLMLSLENGKDAVAKLLINKGATIDRKDEFGNTPLSNAARWGFETITKILLEKGAPVDPVDNMGRTPLSWAAEEGQDAVVKVLIDNGASLDSNERLGRTPLIFAASKGHEAVVRLLLEKGATVDLFDQKHGRTALLWAVAEGYETIVRLLIEKGATVDFMDAGFGWTPLSWAAVKGFEVIARLLIDNGAAVDLEEGSGCGRTPLFLALEARNEGTVKILAEKSSAVALSKTPGIWSADQGLDTLMDLLGFTTDSRGHRTKRILKANDPVNLYFK